MRLFISVIKLKFVNFIEYNKVHYLSYLMFFFFFKLLLYFNYQFFSKKKKKSLGDDKLCLKINIYQNCQYKNI